MSRSHTVGFIGLESLYWHIFDGISHVPNNQAVFCAQFKVNQTPKQCAVHAEFFQHVSFANDTHNSY